MRKKLTPFLLLDYPLNTKITHKLPRLPINYPDYPKFFLDFFLLIIMDEQ